MICLCLDSVFHYIKWTATLIRVDKESREVQRECSARFSLSPPPPLFLRVVTGVCNESFEGTVWQTEIQRVKKTITLG